MVKPPPPPGMKSPPTCGRKNCAGKLSTDVPEPAVTPRPLDSTGIPARFPAMCPGLPCRTPTVNAPCPGTSPAAPPPPAKLAVEYSRCTGMPWSTHWIADMNPEQSNDGLPTPGHWEGVPALLRADALGA